MNQPTGDQPKRPSTSVPSGPRSHPGINSLYDRWKQRHEEKKHDEKEEEEKSDKKNC